jgi:hypothetical protein
MESGMALGPSIDTACLCRLPEWAATAGRVDLEAGIIAPQPNENEALELIDIRTMRALERFPKGATRLSE